MASDLLWRASQADTSVAAKPVFRSFLEETLGANSAFPEFDRDCRDAVFIACGVRGILAALICVGTFSRMVRGYIGDRSCSGAVLVKA
jgi:hypothetical protein